MNQYNYPVGNAVLLGIYLKFCNNINAHDWNNIDDFVCNPVSNTIWITIHNAVNSSVNGSYKLFHYNSIQQYKDNL
jgi:hypothetical protein